MKYRHIGFIVLSISYLYLMSQIGLSFWVDYIDSKGFDFYLGVLIGSLLFTILPVYYGIFLFIDRRNKPKNKQAIT